MTSGRMRLTPEASAELSALLGDRFTVSQAIRDDHGRDESPLPPAAPEAVAFPASTDEVVGIVKICAARRVPLIPFGAGTSLEGHVLATEGGVSIDVTRMNRILSVHVDDLDVVAEAGVTRSQLNDRLKRDGLFFPVDPGANATIGGMTSTGASGTTTVRYGTMRENVLGLEVVLPDARVVQTAHRARKSSAGYDLTRLFVGAEGTLGVITQVTLRVFGIPEAIAGARCHFPSIDQAVRAVISTLQLGIPVARIEFLDELSMKALNDHSGIGYPVAPTLLIEFHGSPQGVAEQAEAFGQVCAEHGVVEYLTALDNEERSRLWRARHDHFYSALALKPGARAITTDVCVPISSLARCILETKHDIDRSGLVATIVGHVGDGNFHVMILVDPDDTSEFARAEELNDRLVGRALAMDGTCTGEHGVGLHKLGYLRSELPEAVEVMAAIKRTLDPHNLMNPGKVLDI